MNPEEREKFWRVLSSLDGTSLKAEAWRLRESIKYPEKMYRFRSINTNTLEGIRQNRLYFSSADKYDDPFDTLMYINQDKLVSDFGKLFDSDVCISERYNELKKIFGTYAEDAYNVLKLAKSDIWSVVGLKSLLDIRTFIQERELSLCFSENCLNESLWLKYAGNHTGIAIEYNLNNATDFVCGKLEKCESCTNNKKISLYPIYYTSNEYDIYDATKYAEITILIEMVRKLQNESSSKIFGDLPNMNWMRERIALIKHKCHEYDEEWRFVHPDFYGENITNRPFIVWKPQSIIFGLRINENEKNIIISLAKEAGVTSFYQCIITPENVLNRIKL